MLPLQSLFIISKIVFWGISVLDLGLCDSVCFTVLDCRTGQWNLHHIMNVCVR